MAGVLVVLEHPPHPSTHTLFKIPKLSSLPNMKMQNSNRFSLHLKPVMSLMCGPRVSCPCHTVRVSSERRSHPEDVDNSRIRCVFLHLPVLQGCIKTFPVEQSWQEGFLFFALRFVNSVDFSIRETVLNLHFFLLNHAVYT